jgi:hypothetical protein
LKIESIPQGKMPDIKTLKKRLRKVEEKLADAEGRLPAHSVRPGQMAAVFHLEEERDALTTEIKKLEQNH